MGKDLPIVYWFPSCRRRGFVLTPRDKKKCSKSCFSQHSGKFQWNKVALVFVCPFAQYGSRASFTAMFVCFSFEDFKRVPMEDEKVSSTGKQTPFCCTVWMFLSVSRWLTISNVQRFAITRICLDSESSETPSADESHLASKVRTAFCSVSVRFSTEQHSIC